MLRSLGHVEAAAVGDADRRGRHVVVAGEDRRRRVRLRASSRSPRDQAGAIAEIALLDRRLLGIEAGFGRARRKSRA